MTITASRGGTRTYDVDEQPHLHRAPIRRTLMTTVEHDWLSDVVADWDVVFNEGSMTATPAVASAGSLSACLLGDRPTTFAWLGSEPLVLHDTPAESMNWHVVFHRDDLWPSPEALNNGVPIVDVAGPESLTADIISAVDTVTHALGVAERDVLAAAGIRDRTYYYWKRNPGTTPRPGSQANLWGVVSSVAGIVAHLDDLAPRWIRADPDRIKLFLSGQHARLALLAAAAAAGVRVPSDTLDAHDVEESEDAQQLKRFRTRYAGGLTHDEDGTPLTRAADLTARFYADEPEEELVLIDVDD